MQELHRGARQEPEHRPPAVRRGGRRGAGARGAHRRRPPEPGEPQVDLQRRADAGWRASGICGAPGEAEPARQAEIHAAFLHTGKSYASEVFATVNRVLDRLFAALGQDVPRGVRGDVGAGRAVGGGARSAHDLPAGAPGRSARAHRRVQRGQRRGRRERRQRGQQPGVARSLRRRAALARRSCARPRIRRRARASRTLRHRLAARQGALRRRPVPRGAQGRARASSTRRARSTISRCVAEALGLMGTMYHKENDSRTAEKLLVDSYLAADASRHDEVRAEDATALVWVVGYQQGRYADAQRWAKYAGRDPAAPRRARAAAGLAAQQPGRRLRAPGRAGGGAARAAAGAGAQGAGARARPPDVGISEGNLAVVLDGARAQPGGARARRPLDRDPGERPRRRPPRSGHAAQQPRRDPERARPVARRARLVREGAHHLGARARPRQPQPRLRADRDWRQLPRRGRLRRARSSPLERAFKIREAQETDPSRRAETRFALARALWESGRDWARARALAEEARESYAKAEVKTKLAEVDTWLHGHAAELTPRRAGPLSRCRRPGVLAAAPGKRGARGGAR